MDSGAMLASKPLSGSSDASMIGADDGAAGTHWTTVAGFISRQLLGFSAFWSIKFSGALGDGKQDDSSAFTRAPGGVTILPPGTYLITGHVIQSGKSFHALGGARISSVNGSFIYSSCAYGVDALTRETGIDPGKINYTGRNTAFGTHALSQNSLGHHNVGIGWGAGYAITTGSQNTLVGMAAGNAITTGQGNVAVGTSALLSLTTGADNTAVGRAAGIQGTTYHFNSLFGRDCAWQKRTGDNDTFFGAEIGWNTTASLGDNASFGWRSSHNLTGQYNTAVGNEALYFATNVSGCTVVGRRAAFYCTVSQITAVGYQALFALTTGLRNTALGFGAGSSVTTSPDNTFLGWQAGLSVTGSSGVSIGSGCGGTCAGSGTVVIGVNAGSGLTAGSQNTIIGASAGTSLATGTGNTVLGFNVQAPAAGKDGQMVLGAAGIARITYDGTSDLYFNADTIRPLNDNTASLGSGSCRWSTIHAANGVIATSDEREKVWRGALTDAELAVAKQIVGTLGFFQWRSAVAAEGPDKARYHFGTRAQEVIRLFMAAGLEEKYPLDIDPTKFVSANRRPNFKYAFLCFDSWEDQFANAVKPDAQPGESNPSGRTTKVRSAGNRFGVRYDELAMFLIAAQEQRLARLEA